MSDPANINRVTPPAAADKRANRRRLLIWLSVGVIAAAVLYGAWALLFASRTITTDNAYVGADTALVTPLVSAPVAKVLVRETQVVKVGDLLVTLDDADARIMVDQAAAALGQAERKVRGYSASDQALAGQLGARDAQVARARSNLERARTDLARRQALSASGAVSGDELTAARNAFAGAQAELAEAQAGRQAALGARQANAVLIDGVALDQNPEVAAARARLEAAQLALSRTQIKAPIDGVVSRKQVQIGQQAQVGAPLMSIVPTGQAYVDANFKEGQLRKLKIGQPVTLTSDLYGGGVTFHGRVIGLSGGTGSAFSLIPAQNASGNWIKVVQRLPVRIQLDPRDLVSHPLRIGLSMKASVDVASAS